MRSLGSGGSADLNVMVSELKDMRESAKGFMNAQNSGNVVFFFFGIKQLLIKKKKLYNLILFIKKKKMFAY